MSILTVIKFPSLSVQSSIGTKWPMLELRVTLFYAFSLHLVKKGWQLIFLTLLMEPSLLHGLGVYTVRKKPPPSIQPLYPK